MTTPAAPNRLRDLRLARGWTQQQEADRLNRLAWSLGHDSAVNADMISKWERGTKGISTRYRRLLAQLYRVEPADLGLDSISPTPTSTPDASLMDMLNNAASILNQLGPAGRVLRSQVLAAVADDALTGAAVLGLLDILPAQLRSDPAECGTAELSHLVDKSESLYGEAPPAALLTTVAAQIRAATAAIDRGQTGPARLRLLRTRGRLSMLAGQLAMDTDNGMAARAYFSQATDDAYELSDGNLLAAALGHASSLASRAGQALAAQAYLRIAALHAADSDITAQSGRPSSAVA